MEFPVESTIEKKFYGDQSTLEEIRLIQARVKLFKEKVIWFDELPCPSSFSVKITFDEIVKHAHPFDQFYLIINLTEVLSRPDAEVRRSLMNRFRAIKGRVILTSVFTGKNIIVNAAASFVLNGFGPIAVNKTKELAIKCIEDAIGGQSIS